MLRPQVGRWRYVLRQMLEAVVLIATATGLLIGGVAWEFFAKDHLGWNRGWRFFVGGAAVYTLTTLYALRQVGLLRRRVGIARSIVAVMIAEAPILICGVTFYTGVLELPEAISPYMVGTILLAPVMALLVASLDRGALRCTNRKGVTH